MSIDISKIDYPVEDNLKTKIIVPKSHFLITLALTIPWKVYADFVIQDLYKDKKRSGKKLNLRLHLGAFILQTLFRWTDRELEENLNFYSPARIFCGIEEKAYDHSAYVKFRQRISEDTVKKFNIPILKTARKKGFTGTQFMDLDSTVQEANIEYPSDIRMMQSIFRKGIKILKGLREAGSRKAISILKTFNIENTSKDFKSYFFAKKSENGMKLKKEIFSKSVKLSNRIVKSIISIQSILKDYELPWSYKKDIEQIIKVAPFLIEQIKYFIKNEEVAPNKILSLHAKEVKCISKGKAGKPYEFGRKFFIGRLPGNYTYTFTDEDFALEDSKSMEKALKEYKDIFDQMPDSVSGDQGFWSQKNIKACQDINEIGINPRGNKNWKVAEEKIDGIKTRRAKVEPLIGHLKRRGMGKSKMKSDKMTKMDGQRSSLSLNLSRLIKDLGNEEFMWIS